MFKQRHAAQNICRRERMACLLVGLSFYSTCWKNFSFSTGVPDLKDLGFFIINTLQEHVPIFRGLEFNPKSAMKSVL